MCPSINEICSNCRSTWKHDHQLLAKDPHWQHNLNFQPCYYLKQQVLLPACFVCDQLHSISSHYAGQTVLKAWADNTEEDQGHLPFLNRETCVTISHIVFIGMTIFEYWLFFFPVCFLFKLLPHCYTDGFYLFHELEAEGSPLNNCGSLLNC